MKLMTWFCCLLLLAGCKSPQPEAETQTTGENHINPMVAEAPVDSARLILPGRSVGRIALEEDMEAVFRILGQPDEGDAAMGKTMSVWKDPRSGYRTEIFASRQMGVGDEKSRVKQIRVCSPSFKTPEGLGVLSSKAEIRRHYRLRMTDTFREQGVLYTLYDTEQGIGFELDQKQVCHAIVVHAPGDHAEAVYIPFH